MKKLTLREQQLAIFNILKYVDQFCNQYNIMYSLGGGTLIGAVRHQGFIPWDDDIDIYMHRVDYEKFIFHWDNHHTSNYRLSLAEDKNSEHLGHCSKIYDKKIILVEKNQKTLNGFIDIFVYDAVSNNPNKIHHIILKHKLLAKVNRSLQKRINYLQKYSKVQKVLTKLFHFTYQLMINQINSLKIKYASSEYVCMLSEYDHWQKSYMPKKFFEKTIRFDFEGEKLPVMNGYHEYLSLFYGDYMSLPPKEHQKPIHSTEAYLID